MSRTRVLWLAVAVALAVVVAVQVTAASRERAAELSGAPVLAAGVDVLAGVARVPARIRAHDYRREAFGDSWSDDTTAPGSGNGCDTRNDILERDLIDKTYVSIERCPDAVATGTLRDPYTNATIAFVRGRKTGADVQIDHIVSAAVTYHSGIYAGQSIDDMPLTNQGELA